MSCIEHIHAREVFDSRGRPTVEVEVRCEGGGFARSIVPSGASTGRFEALELRDGDAERLNGTGVLRAVAHVRDLIAPALIGTEAADQESIDRTLCELDGTADKSRLGANAILGVSLASAYAAASARGVEPVRHLYDLWQRVRVSDSATSAGSPTSNATPRNSSPQANGPDKLRLPLPMVNMISGGLHAGGNLDFQDFLILPVGALSFRQGFEWVVSIYYQLGRILNERGFEGTLVGDEGGYGPRLAANEEAVEILLKTIEKCGLRPGADIAIGLDVASSHFYDGTSYTLASEGGRRLDAEQMTDLLESWVNQYPIVSIEDGLAEEDWTSWKHLTERIGSRVQLIGDDLFVTNSRRLMRGIESGTANSVLVKLNQIGTLWETLQTVRLAADHGYRPVISARSGETEDVTIADLAVATGAGQIKIGSVARSERLAKYNQLLRLEEQLAGEADYIGGGVLAFNQ